MSCFVCSCCATNSEVYRLLSEHFLAPCYLDDAVVLGLEMMLSIASNC